MVNGSRGKERWLAGAALLLLTGCGGGGSGGVSSTPTPTTSTAPTTTTPTTTTPTTTTTTTTTTTISPSTTPNTTINYDDAEYGISNAASSASAITGWKAGATGAGVTIAILDSGLTDATGKEFAGRISSASTSISDGAGYADGGGHGTAVAAVAAAARNGSDIEGVAFGATVMALRTDTTGSCGSDDGCKFSTNTLATAVDYATQHGAKVINMSLGGDAATSTLKAAIGRATAAGIIVVVAAGNDGAAQPDAFAQLAADDTARGLVIIAGAHDASGTIWSYSDKAGSYGKYYLTALGDAVRSFDNKGVDYYYSGTSFAAPAIAAAVALLEQAFPTLTPAQIIGILYASATDAGDTGVDATYGNGLLNLAKAFQPIGTLSLAGSSQVAVSTAINAVLSGAMGDATLTGSGLDRTVIRDGYGRAYRMDLTGTVARIAPQRPLGNAIAGNLLVRDTDLGRMHASLTLTRDLGGQPQAGMAQAGLTPHGQVTAKPVSGSVTLAIDGRTRGGFGFSTSGRRIGDIIDPSATAGSFLIARTPTDGPGFDGQDRTAMAVARRLGGFTLEGSAERGRLPALLGRSDRAPAYTMMTVRAKRGVGPLSLALGLGTLDEEASVLGARFGAALGGRGAATRTADADLALDLGHGWIARGQWRRGWTDAAAGGAMTRGRLETSASSFEFGRQGRGIRFGLRYAEPTRVTKGGFTLSVPDGYDYATGVVSYALTRLDLAPRGHERDVEANVGGRLGGGWIDGNLFWRMQPGNLAAARDDRGMALRWQTAF